MQQRDRWSDLNNPYRDRDENLRRLGFRDYVHYLRSLVWAVIRQKVLERDRYECARCGKTATQVHHRAYDTKTLTGECLHALSSLCRKCHRYVEQPKNRRRARWDRLHEASAAVFKQYRKRKHVIKYEPVWQVMKPPPTNPQPRLVKK